MRSQLLYDFASPPSCSVLGCEAPGLLRVGCPSLPLPSRPNPRVGGGRAVPGPGLGQVTSWKERMRAEAGAEGASDSHPTGLGVRRRAWTQAGLPLGRSWFPS